jgi:aspartyl-tRNA(Asn)/glutamyl-tRNA(Gln) amidotransferase subunit C
VRFSSGMGLSSASLARIAAPVNWSCCSMSVTKDDVRKIARLSRIAVPEEKMDELAQDLSGIMGWIEQLNEVDIEGVEPMTSVVAAKLPMREDVVTDGNIQDQVLANAPKSEEGFFVVPKAVE